MPAIALAGCTVFVLALTQSATGTHVRPKGATPLRDPLVIAQKGCGTPNSIHGAPLAFPSCGPPVQASNFLTAGTPDANGAAANLTGFVSLSAGVSDVFIGTNPTDVRCLSSLPVSLCPSANAADGPDYAGEVQLEIGMRITDHNNSPQVTATTNDFIFPVKVPCATTTSTTIGSTCSISTSMNAVVPGSAVAGKRTTHEIPQRSNPGGIQIYDGGPNGMAGDPNATLFLEPGIFLP
jgi:hypothetical protein